MKRIARLVKNYLFSTAGMDKAKRADRLYSIAFWLILIAGLYLRCHQYFLNRSLWHDEAHLALNFVDRDYAGLLQPLENFQMAPIGFLLAVELCTHIFGFSEMALRLVPFLFTIAAFPLFYFFVADLTKSRPTAVIAFFIFALNLSFIYYASELKPYTIDVSVYVTLGYLLFSQNKFVARYRGLLLATTGSITVFFSTVSPVIFACIGVYFITTWRVWGPKMTLKERIRQIPRWHLYVPCCWLVVFISYYLRFISGHPYSEGMKNIWSSAFCPTPLFGPEFNEFMSIAVPNVVMKELFYFDPSYGYIAAACIIIGIVNCFRQGKYYILVFTALPFLLHLVLSMMFLYPFYHRFIMYTIPGIIVLMAMGMSSVITLVNAKAYRFAASAVVVFCLGWAVKNSLVQFPRYDIRIKPTLQYINANYPNTNVLITTPLTMYEFYYKTGFEKNGNYTGIGWGLDGEQFLNDPAVIAQKANYIVLHAKINDHSDVFMPYLRQKGLLVREYTNNDFVVSELRPAPKTADRIKNRP